jgi:hypothetical protein
MSDNLHMQLFSLVVFGAVALSVVMSLILLVGRGSAYDQIGQGGFAQDGERGGGAPAPALESPAGRAERETEVRQLLQARSERLVRQGRPALDVESEVARLLGPQTGGIGAPVSGVPVSGAHDAALTAEVRQLVVARNERRARQGLPALEVEAEVARTLRELDP